MFNKQQQGEARALGKRSKATFCNSSSIEIPSGRPGINIDQHILASNRLLIKVQSRRIVQTESKNMDKSTLAPLAPSAVEATSGSHDSALDANAINSSTASAALT